MKLKNDHATLFGKTNEVCCQMLPFCSEFSCPAGFEHVVSAGAIHGDSDELCCQAKECSGAPKTCTSSGDPHWRTFNGVAHHAQGHGEYVFAEFATKDCGKVEVHVCHHVGGVGDAETSGVSLNHGVSVQSDCGTAKYVTGKAPVESSKHTGFSFTREGPKRRVNFPGGSFLRTGIRGGAVVLVIAKDVCTTEIGGLCNAYRNPDGSQFVISDHQRQAWGGPYMGEFQSVWATSWRSNKHFGKDECPFVEAPKPPPPPPVPFQDCPELADVALEKCPANTGAGKWVREGCIGDIGANCKLEPWISEATQTMADIEAGKEVRCLSGPGGKICDNNCAPVGNIPDCKCGCRTELTNLPCRSAWELGWYVPCSKMYTTGIVGHVWRAMQVLIDMEETKWLTDVKYGLAKKYSVEFSNDCTVTARTTRPRAPSGLNPNANVNSNKDSWWTCTWFGHIDAPAGGNLKFPKPVKARWLKIESPNTRGSNGIKIAFGGYKA